MCVGCRLERARQWAMRCMHEKRLHSASAWLTLTYRNERLTFLENGLATLVKRDVQLFLKRLRSGRQSELRYFMCGEYGETTQRPHYHVLMLNTSFPDMKFHKRSRSGKNLFASAELDGVWKLGDCLIGEVDFESCAYTAGYMLKNDYVVGRLEEYKEAQARRLAGRQEEYIAMSLKPGLGAGYWSKYQDEICQHDSVIVRGHEVSIPRFYSERWKKKDLASFEKAARLRRARARKKALENTNWRMHHRECFLIAKRRFWKRSSEV